MGFTRKVREKLERLDYDPALGNRVFWPEANISYKQAAPQTIVRPDSHGKEPEVTHKTLLGTFAFLAGLLLVGFIAGYAMRGTAYAGTNQVGMVSMTMTSAPAASGLDIESDQTSLVASIGTQAPDELIQLVSADDDSLSALIRVHDNTEQGNGQISLVQVSSKGETLELLRQDSAGIRAVDMSQLDSGQFVLVSLRSDIIEMRGLGSHGQNQWSRELSIALDHQAGIKVVSMPAGTAIAGPSEMADRISMTYLGTDGELLWQRSFEANTAHPDIWLEPNQDGSIFLVARASENDFGKYYSLMRIDADGQDMWHASIAVQDSAQLAGLAATGDGGVYALTIGEAPTLTKFDALGARVWSVDVTQAKFSNSINLVTAENGNAIIAVSYAIANQRLDVWLEERDINGRVVGEAYLTLPDSSSVEALTVASHDRYLLAGSILPDRFDDADIFVKDVKLKAVFRPTQFVAATMVIAPDAQEDAYTGVDMVDDLTEADDEAAAFIELANATDEAARSETVESTESDIVMASLEPVEPIVEPVTESSLVGVLTDDGAALSRFVSAGAPALNQVTIIETGPNVQAQCRFSCLEEANPSAVFPMWRAITAPQSAFEVGLPAVHELTCRAAGGTRNLASRPDCTPS